MSLKIPEKMINQGPKNNPSPGKNWQTSGSRAYGDAEIRMLNPEPAMPKLGSLLIKVIKK